MHDHLIAGCHRHKVVSGDYGRREARVTGLSGLLKLATILSGVRSQTTSSC